MVTTHKERVAHAEERAPMTHDGLDAESPRATGDATSGTPSARTAAMRRRRAEPRRREGTLGCEACRYRWPSGEVEGSTATIGSYAYEGGDVIRSDAAPASARPYASCSRPSTPVHESNCRDCVEIAENGVMNHRAHPTHERLIYAGRRALRQLSYAHGASLCGYESIKLRELKDRGVACPERRSARRAVLLPCTRNFPRPS